MTKNSIARIWDQLFVPRLAGLADLAADILDAVAGQQAGNQRPHAGHLGQPIRVPVTTNIQRRVPISPRRP